MACDPRTFSGVDATTFAAVQDSLRNEYGLEVDANEGEQSHRGFTFTWSYDAAEETLRIQCTGKPFLVPCGVINSRIDQLAAKSGVATD